MRTRLAGRAHPHLRLRWMHTCLSLTFVKMISSGSMSSK